MKRSKDSNNQRKKQKNERFLDPIFGQYRALPVSLKIYDSLKPDIIPKDAETYLALVRKQSQEGSSIMFSSKNISYNEDSIILNSIQKEKFNKEQNQYFNLILKEIKLQRNFLPIEGKLLIPLNFIYPNNFTEWRSYLISYQPSLAIISNLDHDLIFKLLIYITKWLVHNTPLILTKWIYAILIRIPEVLNSSEISKLRDLAKKAKKIKEKNCNDVSKFICDVILIVCSKIFGQKDLFFI